ncbi:MAG: hypothetical protein FD180_990 [Planctomycetota bacterium]|nr:MAG: hypothetical protein FD180_990 [Planctomycetota bacterium]
MSLHEKKSVHVDCRRERVSAVLDVLRGYPDADFRICQGKLSASGARLDLLLAGQRILIEEALAAIRNLGARVEYIPSIGADGRTLSALST